MKYLIYIPFLLLIQTGCNPSSSDSLTTRKASRMMFGSDKGPMLKWQLLKTYDPYEQGYTIFGEKDNPRFLVFFPDGRFLEYDNRNYNDGSYLIHEGKQAMALIYDIQNGFKVPPARRDSLFRYQLLRLESDTLKLGIQGRHGIVERTYFKTAS